MKKTVIIILAAAMAFSAAPVKALAAGTDNSVEQQDKKKKTKEIKEVTFNVFLHCEDCVKKVNENIAFEKGVKDLKVSLDDQTVYVKYDASKTSEDVLKAAIEKLGYPVSDNDGGHEHHHHDHGHHHN